MPQTSKAEAEALLSRMRGLGMELGSVLGPAALAAALDAPHTHKPHPVATLCRSVDETAGQHSRYVLANVERSLKAGARDTTRRARTWIEDQVNAAARERAIDNASSMLGELRAFGDLWDAGFDVVPIRTSRSTPTRDFDASVAGETVGIEVHCKQMNASESRAMAASAGKPGVHWIYPAGHPKDDETTGENVASKFAQIKPRAKQASKKHPTLLWLDLQDSDWWTLDSSHAAPVVIDRQAFFSGGLWHCIYGEKGIPLFEYNSTEEQAIEEVRALAHNGLFRQSPSWAAVVLSFSRASVVFENPSAQMSLTDAVRESLLRLPWADFATSRVEWPPGAPTLAAQLAADTTLLSALALKARWHW